MISNMKKINIFHTNWYEEIKENNPKILKRGNDIGHLHFIDKILKIDWNNWDSDYFYMDDNSGNDNGWNKKDEINYYSINNVKNNDVSIIDVLDIDKCKNIKKIKYIIDCRYPLRKIYNAKDLNELDYKHNNTFIYFKFKYYTKEYFNMLYKKINVDEEEYLFTRYDNQNICYKNNNDSSSYSYQIFRNKLMIKYENDKKIYIKDNDDKYIPYISKKNEYFIGKDNDIIKSMVDDNCNNDNKNNTDNYVILTNKNIDLINYYIDFGVNIILFDSVKNIELNRLFDDIIIIYYEKFDDIALFNITEKDIEKRKKYILDKIDFNFIKDKWYSLNSGIISSIEKVLFFQNQDNIPKIMHFIWIGNNKIPDEYLEYIKGWIENHQDYILCFWNDSNIPKLINQEAYNNATEMAMKADILRYELLYFFGGIYVDCDFLSIKNITTLVEKYDGFSAYESNDFIAIGLMGFKRYDRILFEIIKNISYNIIINKNERIPVRSGPVYFTKMWHLYKGDNHHAFTPEYFYSYTFKDKYEKRDYVINEENWAIHMWGYSWSGCVGEKDDGEEVYLHQKSMANYFYLKNIVSCKDYDGNNKNIQNEIFFKYGMEKEKEKKRVVNIMGLFFTGGIERYIYYIDKYGDHDKYQYYLLYISNDSYVYEIKNIKMIPFQWNHEYLNSILITINPHLIIDHYSLYLNDNFNIYRGINANNIVYFVHSAICYNKNISLLNMKKCIHLYDEKEKHVSWKNIKENYYVTLGTEIVKETNKINKTNETKDANETKKNKGRPKRKDNINNKTNAIINVAIIGRIAEEKIPIHFFKKLCELSNELSSILIFNIYGEKDYTFNKEYTEKFDILIKESKILLHDFVSPLEMDKIYLANNLILIPSVYETGSFTCIEAFSYGLPVIARNVYGLKSIIKDGINGYLLNNDDEIIEKLRGLMDNTMILNNREIIKEYSMRYDIIYKIKDFEDIIDENIFRKNLVIITSVLNCIDKPLSYYHTRSIFTVEERYLQTMKSIESIRKFIPNVEIMLCDASNLEEYSEMEEEIRKSVDYYHNFYGNNVIKASVESEYKGLGEAHLLLEALKKVGCNNNYFVERYNNVFKLSGRYYLNSMFKYDDFNGETNVFTYWDGSTTSFSTIFYKISGKCIEDFMIALTEMTEELEKGMSIEIGIYLKMHENNCIILDKLNVSGFLATEGYMVTV